MMWGVGCASGTSGTGCACNWDGSSQEHWLRQESSKHRVGCASGASGAGCACDRGGSSQVHALRQALAWSKQAGRKRSQVSTGQALSSKPLGCNRVSTDLGSSGISKEGLQGRSTDLDSSGISKEGLQVRSAWRHGPGVCARTGERRSGNHRGRGAAGRDCAPGGSGGAQGSGAEHG